MKVSLICKNLPNTSNALSATTQSSSHLVWQYLQNKSQFFQQESQILCKSFKCQQITQIMLEKVCQFWETRKIGKCDKSVLSVYCWQQTLQDIDYSNTYKHKYQNIESFIYFQKCYRIYKVQKKKLIKQTKMYRTMHVTKKDYCEGSGSRWARGSAKKWRLTEGGIENKKKTLNMGLDRTPWSCLLCLILHYRLMHGDEDIIKKHAEYVKMPL